MLTRKRRISVSAAVVSLIVAALVIVTAATGISQFAPKASANDSNPTPTDAPVPVICYFNNVVNEDNINGNEFHFGPNRYAPGLAAKEAGEYETVDAFGEYDFWKSITPVYATQQDPNPKGSDPALAAALLLHTDSTLNLPEVLLEPEANLPIKQRADAAHKRFLKHPDQWAESIKKLRKYLTEDEAINMVEAIKGSYTSQMYMRNNGLDGDKPSVIVRKTNNVKGHALVFVTKYGTVKFRMECGYQPFEVPYWPPEDDRPTPTPTPTPTVPPKTGQEPTPDGDDGYKGEPDNPGNPPETVKPTLPPDRPSINPETPPGNPDTSGNVVKPSAKPVLPDEPRPTAQPNVNPSSKPETNDGSFGDPNAIP